MRVRVLARSEAEDGAADGAHAILSVRSHGARSTAALEAALAAAVRRPGRT